MHFKYLSSPLAKESSCSFSSRNGKMTLFPQTVKKKSTSMRANVYFSGLNVVNEQVYAIFLHNIERCEY